MKECFNCRKEEGCKNKTRVYMNGMNACSDWESPKVLISIPCMEMMHTRSVTSLVGLDKPENTEFAFVIGSVIQQARDAIANYAIDKGFDYVLWLDSDMTYAPSTLWDLMFQGKDIVSALSYKKQFPLTPIVYEETDGGFQPVPNEMIPKEIFRTDAVGFGCVLTKTSALKKVRESGEMFSPYTRTGEDISFCMRAKKAGLEIWCDPNVKCGHLTMMEVK